MKLNYLIRFLALTEALSVSNILRNTGNKGDRVLGKSKMLFAAPSELTIPSTITDATILAWFKTQVHEPVESRIFPFFGNFVPLWDVTNNNSNDIEETSPYTNETAFISPGAINREYQTTKGGMPYAEAMISFRNSGYSFMEVDGTGAFMLLKNANGTYSFMPTLSLGGKSVIPPTGTTQFKNRFGLSFDPDIYATGRIFTVQPGLLDLKGLQDLDVIPGTTPSTTTQIYVKVVKHYGATDVTGIIGSSLINLNNFIVTRVSTGLEVVPSAIALVGDQVRLTGTFPAGVYTVELADSDVLYANSVVYFDGFSAAEVTTA